MNPDSNLVSLAEKITGTELFLPLHEDPVLQFLDSHLSATHFQPCIQLCKELLTKHFKFHSLPSFFCFPYQDDPESKTRLVQQAVAKANSLTSRNVVTKTTTTTAPIVLCWPTPHLIPFPNYNQNDPLDSHCCTYFESQSIDATISSSPLPNQVVLSLVHLLSPPFLSLDVVRFVHWFWRWLLVQKQIDFNALVRNQDMRILFQQWLNTTHLLCSVKNNGASDCLHEYMQCSEYALSSLLETVSSSEEHRSWSKWSGSIQQCISMISHIRIVRGLLPRVCWSVERLLGLIQTCLESTLKLDNDKEFQMYRKMSTMIADRSYSCSTPTRSVPTQMCHRYGFLPIQKDSKNRDLTLCELPLLQLRFRHFPPSDWTSSVVLIPPCLQQQQKSNISATIPEDVKEKLSELNNRIQTAASEKKIKNIKTFIREKLPSSDIMEDEENDL